MNEQHPLMEKLHDIEGIDPISWWPLAIGWWLVTGAVVAILLLTTLFIIRRNAYLRSWKSDTLKKLEVLDKNLSKATARATARELSEYVRRIAIHLQSRKECAGLIGQDWLVWLKEHDPQQFDWPMKGALLFDAQYAPPDTEFSVEDIRQILYAIKRWVL